MASFERFHNGHQPYAGLKGTLPTRRPNGCGTGHGSSTQASPCPTGCRARGEFIRLIRDRRLRVLGREILLDEAFVHEYVTATLHVRAQTLAVTHRARRCRFPSESERCACRSRADMARPVNCDRGSERKGERANTWQRCFATLIFADRNRMSVVRRRLPPTRHVHRTQRVRHIALPGIPPEDSSARSQLRSLQLDRALPRRGTPGHEAPDET